MHNYKRKTLVFLGILALLCYISICYARLIVPQPNIFIYRDAEDVAVFTYQDNGTRYECTKAGGDYYSASGVVIDGKTFEISFEMLPESIGACFVNGNKIAEDSVFDVGEWCNFTDLNQIYVITLTAMGKTFYTYAIGMFLFLSIIVIGIYIHREKVLTLFAAGKAIGKKAFLISFVVTLVSCIMFYGCDFVPIVGSINLVQKGMDPYQLSAAFNESFGRQFMYWPYNPGMLIFWDVMMSLNRLFCNVYINYYMWLQVILVKLLNILLLNASIVIVLSVIQKKVNLDENKIRELYYWSVFNPCVFWVAIIFLQFDMYAIFFVTLGLAICALDRKTWWIGISLGMIGCFAKQQYYLCIPIFLLEILVLFCAAMQNKNNRTEVLKEFCKTLVTFFVSVSLGIGVFYLKQGPVFETLSNNPQSERIWAGQISLGGPVFVSAFMLVFVMLLWIQQMNLRHENIIVLSSFLYVGLLQMALSFSIISTPGSYMMIAPSMVVVYSMTQDRLQRFMISCSSILICTVELFSAVGDITRSMYFLGKDPFFSVLYENLRGTNYASILFSISHATMLAFVILFYKKQTSLDLQEKGI